MVLPFYSPGLICPAGWTTAGAAAKLGPSSSSVSGAFTPTNNAIPTGIDGFFEPMLDVFVAALDPGETAVVCCPRFVAHPTIAPVLALS
jgi:hypothetical protein